MDGLAPPGGRGPAKGWAPLCPSCLLATSAESPRGPRAQAQRGQPWGSHTASPGCGRSCSPVGGSCPRPRPRRSLQQPRSHRRDGPPTLRALNPLLCTPSSLPPGPGPAVRGAEVGSGPRADRHHQSPLGPQAPSVPRRGPSRPCPRSTLVGLPPAAPGPGHGGHRGANPAPPAAPHHLLALRPLLQGVRAGEAQSKGKKSQPLFFRTRRLARPVQARVPRTWLSAITTGGFRKGGRQGGGRECGARGTRKAGRFDENPVSLPGEIGPSFCRGPVSLSGPAGAPAPPENPPPQPKQRGDGPRRPLPPEPPGGPSAPLPPARDPQSSRRQQRRRRRRFRAAHTVHGTSAQPSSRRTPGAES